MSNISKDELLSLEAPAAPKKGAAKGGNGKDGSPKSGRNSGKAPAKKRGCLSRIFRFFLWLCVLGVLAAAGGGYALYKWAEGDLPSFSKIADYRPPLVTTVLARDGSVIGQLYRERRFRPCLRLWREPSSLSGRAQGRGVRLSRSCSYRGSRSLCVGLFIRGTWRGLRSPQRGWPCRASHASPDRRRS